MNRTPLLGLGLALLIVAGAFLFVQQPGPSPDPAPPALTDAASTEALPAADSPTAVAAASGDARLVEVWKSPTCGCCSNWIEHMEAAGFTVQAHDVQNLEAIKGQYGVPPQARSCHTAVIDGYVVEGHVPAQDVKRLLEERPEVAGLAVPGMPIGSPGMEVGNQQDPYDVLSIAGDGSTAVYSSYR